MKKRLSIFLCVFAALFFGSCTDMSVSEDEVLKAELPNGFSWEEYGEINNDVKMSQIILDVKFKKKGASDESCLDIFSDIPFAKVVYLDYLQCPVDDCEEYTGKYENNQKYSQACPLSSSAGVSSSSSSDASSSSSSDASSSSSDVALSSSDAASSSSSDDSSSSGESSSSEIASSSSSDGPQARLKPLYVDVCQSGGWSELETLLLNGNPSSNVVKAMCQFIPEGSTSASAKDYLSSFNYDPSLLEQHYLRLGRFEGRPYKYCGNDKGNKRDLNEHCIPRGTSYDCSKYTFCLDKDDQKIYVVK